MTIWRKTQFEHIFLYEMLLRRLDRQVLNRQTMDVYLSGKKGNIPF